MPPRGADSGGPTSSAPGPAGEYTRGGEHWMASDLHTASPSELKQRLEAERQGKPFLV